MSSWGVTAYLPQPSPGKLQISLGCLLGLLDEGVKDHNRLSSSGAEHRSANPFFASGTDLKQPFPQGAGKRHSQMGTKHLHPLGDPCIHGANAHWPRCNVLPDGLAVILNLPWHVKRLTSLLMCCQSGKKPNARYEPLPEAGARNERTLEAVGSIPLLGGVLLQVARVVQS